MMEYIDQKMSKDKPDKEEMRVLTADDELYVIPESMVGPLSSHKSHDKMSLSSLREEKRHPQTSR